MRFRCLHTIHLHPNTINMLCGLVTLHFLDRKYATGLFNQLLTLVFSNDIENTGALFCQLAPSYVVIQGQFLSLFRQDI